MCKVFLKIEQQKKKVHSLLICTGFLSGPCGLFLCLEENQFFFKYSEKIQPSENNTNITSQFIPFLQLVPPQRKVKHWIQNS